MQSAIDQFEAHVRQVSAKPSFMHHLWFAKWHLELVEQISLELAAHYPTANKDMVRLLSWVHDYGKIIDTPNEHTATLVAAPAKLRECGVHESAINTLMEWMAVFDNHNHQDISKAPIEVQIVSSADGCAHLTGPFMQIFWQEFANRPFEKLMEGNLNKAKRDWDQKVVLPEARAAFAHHYQVVLEQNGHLPKHRIAS